MSEPAYTDSADLGEEEVAPAEDEGARLAREWASAPSLKSGWTGKESRRQVADKMPPGAPVAPSGAPSEAQAPPEGFASNEEYQSALMFAAGRSLREGDEAKAQLSDLAEQQADELYGQGLELLESEWADPDAVALHVDSMLDTYGPSDDRVGALVESWQESDPIAAGNYLNYKAQQIAQREQATRQVLGTATAARDHARAQADYQARTVAVDGAVGDFLREHPGLESSPAFAEILAAGGGVEGAVQAGHVNGPQATRAFLEQSARTAAELERATFQTQAQDAVMRWAPQSMARERMSPGGRVALAAEYGMLLDDAGNMRPDPLRNVDHAALAGSGLLPEEERAARAAHDNYALFAGQATNRDFRQQVNRAAAAGQRGVKATKGNPNPAQRSGHLPGQAPAATPAEDTRLTGAQKQEAALSEWDAYPQRQVTPPWFTVR